MMRGREEERGGEPESESVTSPMEHSLQEDGNTFHGIIRSILLNFIIIFHFNSLSNVACEKPLRIANREVRNQCAVDEAALIIC